MDELLKDFLAETPEQIESVSTQLVLLEREPSDAALFRAGSGPLKALPLSLVSRIESVANDRLTQSDGMLIMMHQGSLVPVLAASPDVVRTKATHPILVISIGEDSMGLLVDEIVDVIEEPLDIQIAGTADDVVGTAEIRGDASTCSISCTSSARRARTHSFALRAA
jgi:two-component system, chemotaxis family, sensor kinase CheA